MCSLINNKTGYMHRLTLFHSTPVDRAEKIISTQQFIPGNGLFGCAVYFTNTLEATQLKTRHHNSNKMTILVADVYIGNYIVLKKDDALQKKYDVNSLKSLGISTLFGTNIHIGREIVCLDPSKIMNIKYAYGEKPNAFFQIVHPRITLFKTVSLNDAPRICKNQAFNKSDGPFGKAVYLFYTLADAIDDNKNGTTYLACDAFVNRSYTLQNNETLKSNNAVNNNFHIHLFIGNIQNRKYYIFTDNRLIKNIHFCGGKIWNK